MKSNRNHIIKLGGSVLTGRSKIPSFDKTNTIRIIEELSPYYDRCVFVHGTGSYGKPPAIKYGYYKSGIIAKKNSLIALKIKQSLRQLNQRVLNLFLTRDIPAATFEINSFYDSQKLIIDDNKLKDFLFDLSNHEILPIFYGDLVSMYNGDYKVISSDEIVYALAKTIQPDSVLFLSNIDGVYLEKSESKNGAGLYLANELNSKNIHQLHQNLGDRKDVSGGMIKKATISMEISKYCNNCLIGNGYTPGILSDFLKGKKVNGTYVTK